MNRDNINVKDGYRYRRDLKDRIYKIAVRINRFRSTDRERRPAEKKDYKINNHDRSAGDKARA